jgi:hypothetical protein
MKVDKTLYPWLWALFWLAIFSSSYFSLIEMQNRFLKQDLLHKVGDGKLSTKDGMKILPFIGIGDSLLVYSLPSEADFQSKLDANIKWGMYWMPAASWQAFERFSDAGSENLHDTTFILQDSIFLNRKELTFARHVNLLKKGLLSSIGGEHRLNKSLIEMFHRARPIKCNANERIPFIPTDYSYQQSILTTDALNFLRGLKAQSRQVIVISLQRAPNKQESLQKKWRVKLNNELNKEGIKYLSIGYAMSEEYYCDGSHPNDKGRELRTSQFLQLINRGGL